MSEFCIPHERPIRFVKKILQTNTQQASVEVGFETIPTLGMLVEAAAQSSAGITNDDTNNQIGFVVSLKDIKLLQKPQNTDYIVNIRLEYKMQNLKNLSFEVTKDDSLIAKGSLLIALQK